MEGAARPQLAGGPAGAGRRGRGRHVNHAALFADASRPKRILALGAHADDIEIGCGGTLLRLAAEQRRLEVKWVVLCATPERALEARASAAAFLEGVERSEVAVRAFRDGFLPYQGAAVKDDFEELKRECSPDIIFTHCRDDRHQDHRLVSELTWNTWRNHVVLEYEIPKYDGDFGAPNLFFELPEATLERKIELVLRHFGTQAGKHWLTHDLLRSVARIRGMECVAKEGLAEAFYARKMLF
jgi:LmbE family N-acetylglucosaminyl deacetylase